MNLFLQIILPVCISGILESGVQIGQPAIDIVDATRYNVIFQSL